MEESNQKQIREIKKIRPAWPLLIIVAFLIYFFTIIIPKYSVGNDNPSDALLAVSSFVPVLEKTHTVNLFIFGDMMLDRGVRERMVKYGEEYPFTNIKSLLSGHDIVVGNLEGSFTDFESKTVGRLNAPLTFTFDPTVIPTLKNLGFTHFSLANNHSANFGEDGLAQSRQYLSKNEIGYFGDPYNVDELSKVVEVNGIKIGFVGFHEFAYKSLDLVLAEITKVKKVADLVIVFPHWGAEYNIKSINNQRDLAHTFIDAGADVVMGAHPHVIEPIEVYKDKPIFYSLGNFVFDQDFSFNTTHGLTVELIYTKAKSTYRLIPISIIHSKVAVARPADRTSILNSLANLSSVSENLKSQIRLGEVDFETATSSVLR